jgi:hypothetical protein
MSPASDFLGWNLGFFFTTAIVGLCVTGEHLAYECDPYLKSTNILAIQLFMWCYMISRFRATPSCPGTRNTHILYLFASFLILALSASGAIVWGISIYDMLLRVIPGDSGEIIDAGWAVIDSGYQALWFKGEIAVNIALWVGDALLASSPLLSSKRPADLSSSRFTVVM